MKSKIWGTAAMVLLATALSVTVAAAQCPAPTDTAGLMIKFDADAWSYETAYTPATFSSAAGSQLTVVGIVSMFCEPFLGLDPLDPAKEYTFICDGLTTSQGTLTQTIGTLGAIRYTTQYTGGGFRIYEGSPRNAPTALTLPALPAPGVVPDAYGDGTLILSGAMEPLTVIVNRTSTGTYNGSFKAYYHATGGTYYDRVGDAVNLMDGGWFPVPATNPDPPAPTGTILLPAGWSAHLNGKWDMPRTVPVLPATWGRIKTLYR
jgi:hypothetical protein